jgi:predicted metal-dependent peptidase
VRAWGLRDIARGNLRWYDVCSASKQWMICMFADGKHPKQLRKKDVQLHSKSPELSYQSFLPEFMNIPAPRQTENKKKKNREK